MMIYQELKCVVKTARAQGRLSQRLTNEERADWAYGTTVIENASITREMAAAAAKKVQRRL